MSINKGLKICNCGGWAIRQRQVLVGKRVEVIITCSKCSASAYETDWNKIMDRSKHQL